MDHEGHDADEPAERERAGVTHEHLGRMRVEPQEGHARSDQCAADDGELARAGHVTEQQVGRGDAVVRQVRHDAEDERDRDGAADRQPVEAVGQVDRVAEADDPEEDQHEQRHHGM